MAGSSTTQRKKRKSKVQLRSLNSQEHLDVDKTVKRLRETKSDLRCESFFEKWKDELLIAASDLRHQVLWNKNEESRVSADHSGNCSSPGQMQCVCYGLGPFSSCVSARYQLAMLLLLLEAAQIELSDCFIYDPIFSNGEKAVLKELGLTVLTENEEGKRRANEPTLFYLLHCGKALYNNLLWKNWDTHYLTQMIIIGNCFSALKDRAIDREFSRDYNYISRITSVCKEILLPCPSHMIDVFSDSAVLTFPSSDVDKLSQSTWINQQEPQYEHCVDLEIVQKSKDTSR
uniref:SRR1 domain containing n=1 Tax=Neogobius melanostomus TaxID=47308 RepID=A0A8C6SWX1_9GOBI